MAPHKPMLRVTPGGVPYYLTPKRVKRYNLRVGDDGMARVSAPPRTDRAVLDAFVDKNAAWIAAVQAKKAAEAAVPLPDKAAALAAFTAMSDLVYPAFAGALGGQKPEIRVRAMKSRWGVCHLKKRQITLALQLYNKPEAAQIYVVVHEYCHFLQPDHSPAFWAQVARILPDWKARRALLREAPDAPNV